MAGLLPTRAWTIAAAAALAAWLVLAPGLAGQQPNAPRAGYVYPAGGQRGTSVEVVVGGQFLGTVTGTVVSGRGVRARIDAVDLPLNQRQINDTRDRLQDLQKRAGDPAAQKEIVSLRQQLGESLRRNANPVLAERTTLTVTIDADAEPGPRHLRLTGPQGLSNPVLFVVGALPEFRERNVKATRADMELAVTLPATVNGRMIPGEIERQRFPLRQAAGQYLPGDVDRFRFQAQAGQVLVVVAAARDLMPYLADAVPGWFQATVTLRDAGGRELAYCDDYRFRPDPVLKYEIPADAEYIVEVTDALSRGREDFVYRLTIGALPFITGIFPLGGQAGARTDVQLTGWNLTSGRLTMDGRGKQAGLQWLTVAAGDVPSNRVPFALDVLPERLEREPNHTAKNGQSISLPVIVNGRIQEPGDSDVFTFTGRAGDAVVAEVLARRLDSPLDAVLELTDALGRRVAFNDDMGDKGPGLLTHQADALVTAVLPATGSYAVRIGDVQRAGGPEYAYRLRVSAPRPDFELRVAPSAINTGGAGTSLLTVLAVRRDGFDGEIALELANPPRGVVLGGALVPAGQNQVRLTLTLPPGVRREPFTLELAGRATIQGRTVTRRAAAADEVTQAFVYHHFVPTDELRVSVAGRGGVRGPARVLSPEPVRIPTGGSVRVRIALPPALAAFERIEFELSDPPAGVTLQHRVLAPAGAELVIAADAAKARPGLRGNLIVLVSGERTPPPNAQGPAAQRRRVPLGPLPAIRFEVVGPPAGRPTGMVAPSRRARRARAHWRRAACPDG